MSALTESERSRGLRRSGASRRRPAKPAPERLPAAAAGGEPAACRARGPACRKAGGAGALCQMDADNLAALAIPDGCRNRRVDARRTALTEQLKRLDDRICRGDSAGRGGGSPAAELTRSRRFCRLMTRPLTLRQERDQAWQVHAGALDGETARAFRNRAAARTMRRRRCGWRESEDLPRQGGFRSRSPSATARLSAFREQQQAVLAEIAELEAGDFGSGPRLWASRGDEAQSAGSVAWPAGGGAGRAQSASRTARQELRLARADEERALERLARAFAEFAA